MLLVLAGLASGTAGCPSSEMAERRLRMREENLRLTVDTWGNAERSRPARLRAAGDYIAWNEQRHAENLQRNAAVAKGLWERDVQRFQERQPLYWDKAARILRGKPEQIEKYAIIMFF